MRKRIVSIVLVLGVMLSVLSLASCGGKKVKETTPATGFSTTPVATTDKWKDLSAEVKTTLSESDRSFKIECAEFNEVQKISKNKAYLAGPDDDEVETASSIEQMVYERNKKACDLLGTTIEYDYWNFDKAQWGKAAGNINTLVEANTDGAPDLFVNQIYDLNKAMLTQGSFKDIWSIRGGYFDFSAAGWMDDWMRSLSFTGDRAYVLAGDYFVDVLRSMSVMPFNADLMDANGTKLASKLFNGSLEAGETMSQRFFDFVEGGNWTWDALGLLCEAIWVDRGTVGQDDMEDVLGTIADCYGGVCTAVFIYSSGEELVERRPRSETDERTWAFYPSDVTAIGEIFDKVNAVFQGNGTLATNGKVEDTENGLASHRIKFAKGEILFLGYSLLGDLEDDTFQQMTDLYSVVPLPKVKAESNYNTFVTDTADAGAINVNTDPGKAKAISAYLQYCTEHSYEIREEFLEIVTKYKTTVYNQGTDRMLDLIYDSILYGGAKVIDGAVRDSNGHKRWYDYMKEGMCEVDSGSFKSDYDAAVASKQATLDDILEKWYVLPKVEAE